MRAVVRMTRGSHRALQVALLVGVTAFAPAAYAAALALTPMTKLRLTVVQFVASTGDYKRWDALGGDMDVGPDGTLSVPTLGSIDVSGMSPDQLGAEIGTRLQVKLGLLDAPDATVQVLAYPPIYIVGNVSAPGQYAYQPGMTVVQALALAGGERRGATASTLSDTIKLQSDLDGYASDILRATVRIARLKSEFAKADTITFPATVSASDPASAEIIAQEQLIFQAHINELSRQQTGLVQLADLYNAQIDALQQKSTTLDEQVVQAQKQVESVTALVRAGSATVSRLNDVERALSDLHSQKLDNVIATMTAQENLNRSQRDLAKLQDQQQSDTAGQLQQEQAGLEKLLLNQTSSMRMLRQSVEFDQNAVLASTARTSVAYSIVRQKDGTAATLDATEASALLPGDLVRATLSMVAPSGGVPVADNSAIAAP